MMRAIVITVLLTAALSACQTGGDPGAGMGDAAYPDTLSSEAGVAAPTMPLPGLPLSSDQRFSDIPLPADLHEDHARSFVFESATIQIGRMVYTTKHSVNEVAQFYIRECPAADWRLESVLQAEGVHLAFRKKDKRLDVSVRTEGRRQTVVLLLTPDPEGRTL
ncbi:MAG TPA: hypothetical protein ENN65_01505 [Candidatus Hydrogenedentes bacterium]|nr:hypothetical protein [Candidatus Hydrogenedentota bacterium]